MRLSPLGQNITFVTQTIFRMTPLKKMLQNGITPSETGDNGTGDNQTGDKPKVQL